VEADYGGAGNYYPGTIAQAHGDGRYDITYDDGDEEMGVDEGLIRLPPAAAKAPVAVAVSRPADGDGDDDGGYGYGQEDDEEEEPVDGPSVRHSPSLRSPAVDRVSAGLRGNNHDDDDGADSPVPPRHAVPAAAAAAAPAHAGSSAKNGGAEPEPYNEYDDEDFYEDAEMDTEELAPSPAHKAPAAAPVLSEVAALEAELAALESEEAELQRQLTGGLDPVNERGAVGKGQQQKQHQHHEEDDDDDDLYDVDF